MGRFKYKIIIKDDKNKLKNKSKNIKIENIIKSKNKNNVEYSFSHEGKFINTDDKKKFEDRIVSIKKYTKLELIIGII